MNLLKKVISFFLVLSLCLGIFSVCVYADDVSPLTCEAQTGLSGIYDYTTLDTNGCGTIYVNQYRGILHIRRGDFTLGGERLPVEIEFYYDPANIADFPASSANPYGVGWLSSYNQLISYDEASESYSYRNANGTWITFYLDSVDDDCVETWKEETTYGIGATGAVLTKPDDSLCTDYTAVDILCEDLHYRFDTLGRLSCISSGTNQILITYSSDSSLYRIQSITDSVGRQFCFTYANGFLTRISCKDANNAEITFGTQAAKVDYTITDGNLTCVDYGNNTKAFYEYDSSDRVTLLKGIDNSGYAVAYSAGKVSSLTQKAALGTANEASGTQTTFAYGNNSVLISDGDTQQSLTFDGCGRVSGTELRLRSTDRATRGTSSIVYTLRLGLNYTFGFVTHEDGTVTNEVVDAQLYDSDGTIENEETSEEETTEEDDFSYTETKDNYGNVLTATTTKGNLSQTVGYTYTDDGNYLLTETDSNGKTVRYNYDTTTGLLQSFVNAAGDATTYSYDPLRELTSAYLDVTTLTDEDDLSAQYSYEFGRLTGLDFGDYSYTFTYDVWGNVLTVSMNDRLLITYNYGNYGYDGTVESLTYGNGKSVFYTYTNLGQVATVAYDSTSNLRFQYAYDSNGALTTVTDVVSGQVTTYTDNGYSVRTSSGSTLLYSIEYDEDTADYSEFIGGARLASAFSGTDNTTKTVTNGLNTSIITSSVTNDALGRTTQKTNTAGSHKITTAYTYYTGNAGKAGTQVKYYKSSYPFTETALGRTYNYKSTVGFTYTYDANGNILTAKRTDTTASVTPTVPIPDPNKPVEMSLSDEAETQSVSTGTTNYLTTYTYDEAGQLLSAVDEETGYTYRYTYNSSGNLETMKTYTTDENGEETLVSSKTLGYTNGILSSYKEGGTPALTYVTDAMGNPTGIKRRGVVLTTFTWGEARSLTGYTRGTTNATYSYDQNGLRRTKTVTDGDTTTTTNFIWSDDGLAGTLCGSDRVIVLYDAEREPIGFSLNGTVYTYIKNLQGDIVRVLDAEKSTVISYTYDPWGVPTVTGDTDLAAKNPCTYRGYYYDQETGYYYLQSRYYDPTIGRFLNADDVEYIASSDDLLSANIFAYCNNSPNQSIDPDGHEAVSVGSVLGAVCVAAVILILYYYYTSYVSSHFNEITSAIYSLISRIYLLQQALTNVVKKALSRPRVSGTAKHHIIARSHYKANYARGVWVGYGFNLNSGVNIVKINTRFHYHLHTYAYYESVEAFIRVGNVFRKWGVFATVCIIHAALKAVSLYYFR